MEAVQNVVTYRKEQSRNRKNSGIRIADAVPDASWLETAVAAAPP